MVMSDTNADYEDILVNLDDYEYPYNHVNKKRFVGITLTRTHAHARTGYIKINI